MVKLKTVPFTEALESVLINIWGGTKDQLDEPLVKKTRQALVQIRGVYRFKGDFPGKYPSTIQYRLAKNRAGYLAAFGQRHAYLTYAHLKMVEQINPEMIPRPRDGNSKLVVTILGAGAAIETYGLCLFYNESTPSLRQLYLNLIDKVDAWKPSRHTVFDKVLQSRFPKLDVIPTDINADLTTDCIPKFAHYHDNIATTDILLIYNVMNEIHSKHASKVWRNINFLLKTCERPLLVLVMEPSIPQARPRVDWLKAQLAQCSQILHQQPEEEILFDHDPVMVEYEGTNTGLNDRLFGRVIDGGKPLLQRSLKRTHVACRVMPGTPITREEIDRQLGMLRIKRGKEGRFMKVLPARQPSPQGTFWDSSPDWDKVG